jgi:U32 family peptidase
MRKIELLAPGGDVDSIKAAIAAGADAVYCGVHKFNARNRASNITFEDLSGILRLAHNHNCKIFLTLNILITENEIPDLLRLLNKLVNTSIDGVIIQDLGLFYLLSTYFPSLEIHASTQLTTHNEGQIKFLAKLSATRVNLSRELNLEEIKILSTSAHENGLLTEVFVHGSYCISFSGLCYMSSVQGGNSGNRGRCSQPCREQYELTPAGKHYPLNLKDNSAWADLKELSAAGVDSVKIEGRIKKYHYVFSVVEAYRKQLQRLYEGINLSLDKESLKKTFNRSFSNGFLKGDINRDMFVDNPRDISTTDLTEFTEIKSNIKGIIDPFSIEKGPLKITVSGRSDTPLQVSILSPDSTFVVSSDKNLIKRGELPLSEQELLKRFKAINETEYFIDELDIKDLSSGLHLPFSELSSIRNRILFILKDSRAHVAPAKVPVLLRPGQRSAPPALSVLISSKKDLHLIEDTAVRIYFQLPDSPSNNLAELIELFRKNSSLIPWFPPVLIGEEFFAAVKFIQEVQPGQIVTNNTGIAFEANQMGIPWVAGPFLNVVNSYSLIALKENFNCAGAFISNELSRQQIKGIRKPAQFDLFYSIYHPIELMTSRQCLFQQANGCEKERMDEDCIQSCRKIASIRNLKKETLFIEKGAGNFCRIYNESNYLNTDIVADLPDLFTGFLVDLRDLETSTKLEVDKIQAIRLFRDHLRGDPHATAQLGQAIHPTNYKQYLTGI